MEDGMLVLNNLRAATEAMASHIVELYAKISQLESEKACLIDAIVELHNVAASCDSWESFPQYALDEAMSAVSKATREVTE